MLDRKGQVTIFVIVGLVLLISAALVLYITNREVNLESEARRGVSSDALPVYDYVVSCARQTAKDGLVLIGQQGGFSNIPPKVERTPSSYLSPDGQGIIKIPFWYFEGQDRSPDQDYVRGQLISYLQENMPDCLNNLTALRENYNIEILGPLSFDTLFTRSKVIVTTRYEMDVEISDQTRRLDEYVTELDLKLADIISLARHIMASENEHQFLENVTVDLMALHPDIPLNGLEIDCDAGRWPLAEVEAELKRTLEFNLPTIRVQNTITPPYLNDIDDYERLEDFQLEDIFQGREPEVVPLDAYEYLKLRWDVGVPPLDLEASVAYQPHYGMDFNGQPNEGGVLKTKLIKGAAQYLSFLCINFHHFTYDVIYPVTVTIRDSSAFNGEGYLFQYAFPVIIENNEGKRESFTTSQFEGFTQATEFCEDRSGPVAVITAEGLSGFGAEPLDNVNITMKCLRQRCLLGQTAPSFEGDFGTYQLTTPLPLGCTNPFIEAQKEGYLTATEQLTGDTLTLQMRKLVPYEVRVVKHPYLYKEQVFLQGEDLLESEHAIINVDILGADNSQYLLYPGNDTVTVNLVDDTANYDFNVLLTRFGDLVGGYNADNLSITIDEIDGKRYMTFHVFEYRPTLRDDEYIAQAMGFLVEGNQSSLRPTFE